MSDTPELAIYEGHAPRYFPALGRSVAPGDEVEVSKALLREYGDVFRPATVQEKKAAAKAETDKEAD